ncbi:Uncharacterized protein TCM_024645 [Theobroma cacao]|uniref:Uncharacterized protein n=1 Tax=Theobroma cacao TaxID=3641 RepID=A0A061EWS2_THECC|nr:Uncharacterized protein TCM_024645 [Theobroma cacao]
MRSLVSSSMLRQIQPHASVMGVFSLHPYGPQPCPFLGHFGGLLGQGWSPLTRSLMQKQNLEHLYAQSVEPFSLSF